MGNGNSISTVEEEERGIGGVLVLPSPEYCRESAGHIRRAGILIYFQLVTVGGCDYFSQSKSLSFLLLFLSLSKFGFLISIP